MSRRLRVLEQLDVEFVRIVESSQQARQAGRRLRRRLLPTVAAVLLLSAGGAFAASQLIRAGAPVTPSMVQPVLPPAHATGGEGAVIPSSVKLVALAAADPAGGLPWGLRVFRTTHGMGCVQIGRLYDGHLGILGEDGAFDNDGRFHPLAAQPAFGYGGCIPLDAAGQTYLVGSLEVVPASGLQLACTPEATGPRDGKPPQCPARDEREVDYGLLGPQAKSIGYLAGGRNQVLHTVGTQGAYLIVRPADPAALKGFARPAPGRAPRHFVRYQPWNHLPYRRPREGINIEPALILAALPHGIVSQPIRKIIYRNGATCTIRATSDVNGAGRPCRPAGYVSKR